MKAFWKIFIVSLISFFIAFFLGSYTYVRQQGNEVKTEIAETEDGNDKKQKALGKSETYASRSEAFSESERINVMILGMEGSRTDTIMLTSFSPKTKQVDIISIPRDTYIHRRGYDKAEQRKINSIYGGHGSEGVKKAISYILGNIPIHHTIMIDYGGVIDMVDSVGGVDVLVPFDMKYKDPTSKPPLNIDIKKGRQTLDGKNALDFLRYRKGNGMDVGYADGDLGRIKAQQQFLSSFVKKTLSYRLPAMIKNSFNYVKTDIRLMDALSYGKKAMGIKSSDFHFTTLPGKPEFRKFNGKLLSYYIYDSKEIEKKINDLYPIKTTP